MANYVNYIVVRQTLKRLGLRLFSPLELERALDLSPVAARFLVHRYAKRGVFLKLRKGLYAAVDEMPSELVIANRLYEPSYLSFEFALAYHHVIPEAPYVLTSATPRSTRTLIAAGRTFDYHRLKRTAFTGYVPMMVDQDTVLIATPEKAFVDCLYFVDLQRKPPLDRVARHRLNRHDIRRYAKLFDRPSLLKLVKGLG
jgi:predicted transcriptional regulator of viral defense system